MDLRNGWTDELIAAARMDEWCRECEREGRRREPEFLAIREKLPEEEQEALDMYIAACEEQNHALIYPAYRLGWRDGRNGK